MTYATSRLSPEIFSHPVWLRFGKREASDAIHTVEHLLHAVNEILGHDPGCACQLLLICAVYQIHAGQHGNALKIVQRALVLAESLGLVKEMIWSAWGASAICFQEGNHEQTARYLTHLQGTLNQQNEWVLADFIDIVKQSLPCRVVRDSSAKRSEMPRDQSLDNVVTFTFGWLQHWGFSPEPHERAIGAISDPPLNRTSTHSAPIQSLFSAMRWKGYWHDFKLAINGGLKLRQAQNNPPPASLNYPPYSDSPPGNGMATLIINKIPQTSGIPTTPPANAAMPPIAVLPELIRPASTNEQNSIDNRSVVTVAVQMLGSFSITVQDLLLKLPTSRVLSLLQYLMLHHKQNTPREILMDVFWPDTGPENARNNLNVAMHRIRQMFHPATDLPVIHYQDGMYGIAPCVQIWLDVEEFEHLINTGQRLESRNQLLDAASDYETAISLYQGDFLEENSYEGWTALPREHLRMAYLETLDHLSQIYYNQASYAMCISLCQRILIQDRCREDAHCMLMRCYNQQGQDHLALRQYQACVDALRIELDVAPAPATTQLYQQIRQHRRV